MVLPSRSMRLRLLLSCATACSLVAGISLATGEAALGQDAVSLGGEMVIGGAHLVDPPPGEAKNTHAYLTVTGPAALRLFRNMPAREEDDLCRGEGRKLKRAGDLSCSIAAGGKDAICDYALDLRTGKLAGGRPC